ncbi:MAG: metallophosphoesterase [Candidatus Jettenia sp.]|uniref:Phosphoesterase n=1 Tax=Candidatus Jettenia caeni TaxID=247490 RepID=I3IML9_9BACT|nr:metallophosphoesterase family protein [Candidatus Jettenia sp. AMX1]MBC6928776.1 metallophosphoesterase [Candidatus Jettenia sp.]NUN23332.1 metallophosphoesterase family protein [Candidatus Jettenia caeni]MCE7880088.1 metallophosphoesterase [Candidatus Jettenia sp. AMX1]MCQ3926869.1 metallophosphoesterase [Candidatus Jettenia sp.]MDL1938604.1 metallophosphoesterase family protein [Candidatus Jettenia sp. AMX1]
MKILIISDIHGNLNALEAVCKEEADLVFCLGDIVNYGPYPGECIKKVQDLTDTIVRGNHDHAVGRNMDCGCSVKYQELSNAGKAFTRDILNTSEKNFLGNLPITLHREAEGKLFLLVHGSPSGDIYKYLKPDISDEELEDKIKGIHADVIFIGHTHLPMIRRIKDIVIVNPGSVGQPRDGVPEASYAVWEDGHIEIKRVQYNIEATIRGLQATNMPYQQIEILAGILRKGGM